MSILVDLLVQDEAFEFTEAFSGLPDVPVRLETVVPAGGRTVPLVWIHDVDAETIQRQVGESRLVADMTPIQRFDDRTLVAVDWHQEPNSFFGGIVAADAQILGAVREGDTWQFEVRFPSRSSLSAFDAHCQEVGFDVTVNGLYGPESPETERRFGLTDPQYETLVEAVDAGYFDVPRRITTAALADRFDVSDQAITERLRRGIKTLVSETLLRQERS
jgi:hypothetical protein